MTTVYEIWCEWDIGQEDIVFSSKENARQWLEENQNLRDLICYEFDTNIDELFKAGLLSYSTSELD